MIKNTQEKNVLKIIKQFSKKLPKFTDGRIDYHTADIAPVLTIFLKYQDQFLLLKRSGKVRAYQGKWNVIAGYLDELKPLRGKILEEIKEETSVDKKHIASIFVGKIYHLVDAEINKTWFTVPVLVELRKLPKIKLDWEHTRYQWTKLKNFSKLDLVYGLKENLKKLLKQTDNEI